MTRFARAKGSKASNERLPNEATPWHVMKKQLQDTTEQDDENIPGKSAKQLLKEADAQNKSDSTAKASSSWAEFENNKQPKTEVRNKKAENKKQKAKSVNREVQPEKPTNVLNKSSNSNKDVKFSETVTNNTIETEPMVTNSDQKKKDLSSNATSVILSKLKKKKRKMSKSVNAEIEKDVNTSEDTKTSDSVAKLSKRQKRNLKRKNENQGDDNQIKVKKLDDEELKENDRVNVESPIKKNAKVSDKSDDKPNNKNNFQSNNNVKRKPPKVRDDKEHKRRKPDTGPIKLTINGVEVEIVKFDGYPVKKEDAERLKELRQKMVMKGIPKSEIDAAMKLERRKAEKALVRLKKCVCFHCRKSGHNLSDCPELANEQSGTGICFKCGSTEHTHFECKVAKPTEFRYATCFICREQGHIAKQCPDNPKGVYPQGGACKICGDVTHLKKDCPDLAKEKEEATVTVDKIADSTLECLEEDKVQTPKDKHKKQTSKKVVKF